jgi:hypothetical protein
MAEKPLSETRRRQLAAKASRAEGIPIETLLSFTDENLRTVACDFTAEERAERMRNTDSAAYSAKSMDGPNQVFALIEFLANVPLLDLESLARDPERTSELLARDYLWDGHEIGIPLESVDAAEAALTDARNVTWARLSWNRVTPNERAAFLEVFERLAGKAAVNALGGLLDPA